MTSRGKRAVNRDPYMEAVNLLIEILQYTPYGGKMVAGTDYHVLKDVSFQGSCLGSCDCEGHEGEAHEWPCDWGEFSSWVGLDDLRDAMAELLDGGRDWPRYTIPDEVRAKADKFFLREDEEVQP